MELSERLALEMEVSRIQANKMTNLDGDTMEETLHEEQQAMTALGMARQVRPLVRRPALETHSCFSTVSSDRSKIFLMENEFLVGENEEMLVGKDATHLVAITFFFFLSGTYVTHVTWRLSEERLWN